MAAASDLATIIIRRWKIFNCCPFDCSPANDRNIASRVLMDGPAALIVGHALCLHWNAIINRMPIHFGHPMANKTSR